MYERERLRRAEAAINSLSPEACRMIVLMLMAGGTLHGSHDRIGAILGRSRFTVGKAKAELIRVGIARNQRNVLVFASTPMAALVLQNIYSTDPNDARNVALAQHSDPTECRNVALAQHSDPNDARNVALAQHSPVIDRHARARARSSDDAGAGAPTCQFSNAGISLEKGGAGGAAKKARGEQGRQAGAPLPSTDQPSALVELLRHGIDGVTARRLCEHGVTIEMIRATDASLNGAKVRCRGAVLAKRLADALGVTLPRGSRASIAPDVAAASERIRQLRASIVASRGLEAQLSRDQGSRDTRSSPC